MPTRDYDEGNANAGVRHCLLISLLVVVFLISILSWIATTNPGIRKSANPATTSTKPGTQLRHPAFCDTPCTFWGILSIVHVDSDLYVVADTRSGEIVESLDYTCRIVGYIAVEDCLAGSVDDIKGNPAYWFIIHKDTPTHSTQYRSYEAWLAALPKPQ